MGSVVCDSRLMQRFFLLFCLSVCTYIFIQEVKINNIVSIYYKSVIRISPVYLPHAYIYFILFELLSSMIIYI